MRSHLLNGKLLAISAAVLLSSTFGMAGQAHASSYSNVPLEITPICSRVETGQAFWKVVNKNPQDVTGTWTRIKDNVNYEHGSFTARPGTGVFVSAYRANDNNTTAFVSFDDHNQTNATAAGCENVADQICLNGSIQQNLAVSIDGNKAVIGTLNSVPLCAPVHINFSSYIMPANYDGNGFYGNLTAYPQALFSTTAFDLVQGETSVSIDLPDSCNNIQVDVYYGNTITVVGAEGHGTANILSQVYRSSGACQIGGPGESQPATAAPSPTVSNDGGMGSGSTTTASAVSLPDTGAAGVLSLLTAFAAAAATILVTRRAQRN